MFLVIKNGVKSIETTAYNGKLTVPKNVHLKPISTHSAYEWMTAQLIGTGSLLLQTFFLWARLYLLYV